MLHAQIMAEEGAWLFMTFLLRCWHVILIRKNNFTINRGSTYGEGEISKGKATWLYEPLPEPAINNRLFE